MDTEKDGVKTDFGDGETAGAIMVDEKTLQQGKVIEVFWELEALNGGTE